MGKCLERGLGAASLFEQLDKEMIVCLRDGRNFIGRLGLLAISSYRSIA